MSRQAQKRRRRIGAAVLLALGALFATSCGNSGLSPVKGKVLYKGAPIKGAVVTLHPKAGDELTAQRPSGVTGEDGSFQLSTGNKPGAPAGDYVVTVVWIKEPEAKAKKAINTEGPPEPEDQLKGRYADRTNSRLSARISGGPQELDPINLE